jgi:predicted RNA-binding Zn-ribbon protein involved in translation (DUF1610 family)
MYNQDEIIEAIAKQEREAMALWESQTSEYHSFSTDLDGEVMRCDNCGMNVLTRIATCEEYSEYNAERNRKFRERMGLVTNA